MSDRQLLLLSVMLYFTFDVLKFWLFLLIFYASSNVVAGVEMLGFLAVRES